MLAARVGEVDGQARQIPVVEQRQQPAGDDIVVHDIGRLDQDSQAVQRGGACALSPWVEASYITALSNRVSMMIKHIVMWNVRGDSAAERSRNALALRREFESLRGCIPGLRTLEIGVDSSCIDYACDVVLYSEFDRSPRSTPMLRTRSSARAPRAR